MFFLFVSIISHSQSPFLLVSSFFISSFIVPACHTVPHDDATRCHAMPHGATRCHAKARFPRRCITCVTMVLGEWLMVDCGRGGCGQVNLVVWHEDTIKNGNKPSGVSTVLANLSLSVSLCITWSLVLSHTHNNQ